jgi:hypothetical protein
VCRQRSRRYALHGAASRSRTRVDPRCLRNRLPPPTPGCQGSPSTARRAQRGNSAAAEPRARPGPRWSRPGRLDHSSDPAPMPRSLAAGHGGTRSVAAARLESGRSRPEGPRTRIRLVAQAKATIPPCGSVQNSHPPRCGNCGKLLVMEPNAHRLALKRRVLATLRWAARCGITQTGDAHGKSSERARTSAAARHLVAFPAMARSVCAARLLASPPGAARQAATIPASSLAQSSSRLDGRQPSCDPGHVAHVDRSPRGLLRVPRGQRRPSAAAHRGRGAPGDPRTQSNLQRRTFTG